MRFVPGAILSRGVLITVLSLLTVFKSSTPGLPPPLRQGEAVFAMQKHSKTLRCAAALVSDRGAPRRMKFYSGEASICRSRSTARRSSRETCTWDTPSTLADWVWVSPL